jgi:hypothetical protein
MRIIVEMMQVARIIAVTFKARTSPIVTLRNQGAVLGQAVPPRA